MNQDKHIERDRYDAHARELLACLGGAHVEEKFGSHGIRQSLRTPYLCYEQQINKVIRPQSRVLELAAGAGMHTSALLQTGAHVTATDISPLSLKMLEQRFRGTNGHFVTAVADMEALPFSNYMFDVVVCAGGLSYGQQSLVDAEIRRVLRLGGTLICVDSLNHNPVYRANRLIHYLRGNRSKSTLKRMPDQVRIKSLSDGFSNVSVRYFGAISFAAPLLARLLGEKTAQELSDGIDQWIGVRRSAFKFVLVAQGLLG
jgi:ubiquinone/menaquinone biosynthesis C-methylase UbiE